MHRYHGMIAVVGFLLVLTSTVGMPWSPVTWLEVKGKELEGGKMQFGSEMMQISRQGSDGWAVIKMKCSNQLLKGNDLEDICSTTRGLAPAVQIGAFLMLALYVMDPDSSKESYATRVRVGVNVTTVILAVALMIVFATEGYDGFDTSTFYPLPFLLLSLACILYVFDLVIVFSPEGGTLRKSLNGNTLGHSLLH